jgi:streptogramin lyase/ABC-type dipeptide/oligopeptide/nickel transport system permease subunit
MGTDGKRTVIAAARRIIFAGIILLAVWLILLAFRGNIPSIFVIEHNVPAGYAGLEAVAVGPDGNIWFTETYGNQIGKISLTNSKIFTYDLANDSANASSHGIVAGPDGNLWFTEIYANKIAKISPITDDITDYNVPTANSEPTDIVRGFDGNLWFVEEQGNKIGKLSPENGMITEYSVPTTKAFPDNITASPDGNLWFTEFYTNKIGNISPSTDIVTEYNIPIANAGPAGIAMGPDGNLWFTESSINKIGEISPITSVITEYDIPVADAGPTGITAGPDGNLWFTEEIGNIGEISPKTGVVTEYNVVNISPTAAGLPAITAGPDGNLWFTEFQGNISKISPITGIINEYNVPLSHNTATWDWSKSLHENTKVSTLVGPYIGNTLRAIALIALLSLLIAGILLLLGMLISAVAKKPAWLVKVRGVLRLILVSGGASIPVFVISAFIMIYILRHEPSPQHPVSFFLTAFYCALLPAWLLVQTGYRLTSDRGENTSPSRLAQQVSIRLLIRVLKLTGLIIVTTIMAGWLLAQPGLGTSLIHYLNGRDFPVIFGIVWILVIIVVLAKLVAELIEIAYNHFGKPAIIEPADAKPAVKNAIPKGWLILSLGLCALIILVAIIGPLFAPDPKMIHLLSRVQPPSSKFLLGTDQLGRDILSRLVAGIRTDILMGLGAAAAVSVLAAGWALLAAQCRKINNWRGDTLGDIVMLPGDIISAFPWLALLLLLMDMATLLSPWLIALSTGVLLLPRAASMIQESRRSAPKGINGRQNMLRSIPVVFVFVTAGVVLYVSALGWLGFGAPPGIIELGAFAASGNAYLQTAPWLVIAPSIVLIGILWLWVMTGEALLERLGLRSGSLWSKTME